MTSALDAAALESALRDLAARCLGGANASLTAFNALTETHLAALDQATALVDSAREDMQHTTDVAFAGLLAQTRVRTLPHPTARSAPPPTPLLTRRAPPPPPAGGVRPVCGD
jgi:hypothetical protein